MRTDAVGTEELNAGADADADALLRDAVTEILNIGIGHAAATLSEMVHEEVELCIPHLEIATHTSALQQFTDLAGPDITAISQQFSGEFSGEAVLFFPRASSENLLRSVLNEELTPELLQTLAPDALMEIGNIILNACFGTISNVLQLNLNSSLPLLMQGRDCDFITSRSEVLLISHVHFGIKRREISGYVSFFMDLGNFKRFRTHVDMFIQRMSGA